MSNQNRRADGYIGLMSGTSLDGVDAALVRFHPTGRMELDAFITHSYPTALKTALNRLNETPTLSLKQLCTFEREVAAEFVQATQTLLKQTSVPKQDIIAIGSHGQTIFHAPSLSMSLQIGHPAFIAKGTGVTTVADFRIDDMANHGQGAPLAPAFHRVLFQVEDPIAVINIGGIANISYLSPTQSLGFDIGPGNGLMDDVCRAELNCDYDPNGDLAADAQPNQAWLNQLLSDPYFSLPFPKTTGKDYFNQAWLKQSLDRFAAAANMSAQEKLSTLNQLTVETLKQGIASLPAPPSEILISGGGADNATLLKRLQQQSLCPVRTTRELGISPHAIEAMMCAWLAKQRLDNQPIGLKTITGAHQDSILGGVWAP
ncbi:MAG: anhydro-N-acetylmuramic acid kinase [Hydrogenovibrio sp.]